jgi:hypothetical protein
MMDYCEEYFAQPPDKDAEPVASRRRRVKPPSQEPTAVDEDAVVQIVPGMLKALARHTTRNLKGDE